MKGKLLIAAVLVGVLVGVSGISHAGGWMHKSGSSRSGEMAPMGKSADAETPSSDSWQYFEATETGNFPHPSETGREPARTGPPVRWDSSKMTTTIGGLEFRDVDLGP